MEASSSPETSRASDGGRLNGAARHLVRRLLEMDVRADPYPLLNRIRAAGPVWMSDDVVVFSSHEHCEAVLREGAASTVRTHANLFKAAAPQAPAGKPVQELTSFLFLDPPAHTRLRRLVSRSFTPRMVRGLDPVIRDLVDDLLDAAVERGRLEVVADLAYPLPVAVICRMLGVPLGDEVWFRERSSLLSRALDPHLALTGRQPPGLDQRRSVEAELNEYFVRLAAERRRAPGDDLLSALIAAEVDGDRLTPEEISTTCRFLLNAGHETTVNLLSNGVLALVRDPERQARLVADPASTDPFVEEVLRLDPPLHLVHRYAASGIDVCGTRVEAGTTMVLLLSAAHRDPAVHDDPDGFAPAAEGSRHLAFGLGTHFCLGAPLARLEARLAFSRFAQRVVAPRSADGRLSYKPNVALRGLQALPLSPERFLPRTEEWLV
ncbi:cytochrome P450 [Spirillospora sp. NPDC047279]|uniref:cytochrome P450 n=1 Tax=Spirillospora sp. NPDC047279 TaxID=3155478 RepID=UPI003406D2E3